MPETEEQKKAGGEGATEEQNPKGENEQNGSEKKETEGKSDDIINIQKELEETKQKLSESEAARAEQTTNLKRLRDMTKEEKAKLSEREISLQKQWEDLEDRQSKWEDSQRQAWRDNAIKTLAGEDEKLREQLEANYGRITGDENSQEQIETKMSDAYNMLGTDKPNPLLQAHSTSGEGPKEQDAGFTESTEGQELSGKLGLPAEETNEEK